MKGNGIMSKHFEAMENALYAQARDKYERLSFAIILRAIKDYRYAVKMKNPGIKKECERFFNSQWYDTLTTLPGDMIMSRLKAEEREYARKETAAAAKKADKASARIVCV